MTCLEDLPAEILNQIGSYAASEQYSCLANLAAVCKSLRDVFQPLLYQKWSYLACIEEGPIDTKRINPFAETLERRPDLGSYLHAFEIITPEMTTADHTGFSTEVTPIFSEEFDKAIARILVRAPHLRTIHVPYPRTSKFLETTIPGLEVLSVYSYSFYLAVRETWSIEERFLSLTYEIDIGFLSRLFQSSMLKVLRIGAHLIMEISDSAPSLPEVSTLKTISISTRGVSTGTLCWLIKSATSLEDFSLTLLEMKKLIADSRRVRLIKSYPNIGALVDTLQLHCRLLRCLVLRCPRDRWLEQPGISKIDLSLFSHLQHLELDEYLLFGWRPCSHIPGFEEIVHPRTPANLPNLLPSSLKTMILRLDVLYSIRYEIDFATNIVESLIRQQDRLPSLVSLAFHFPYVYCKNCEHDQDLEARASPPTNPWYPVYGVNSNEALRIKSLLSAQESRFSVEYQGNDAYWIGAVDGKNLWVPECRQ